MAIVDVRSSEEPEDIFTALRQRLEEAWKYFFPDMPFPSSMTTASLVDMFARSLSDDPTASRVWLSFIVVSGAFPTSDDLLFLQRRLRNVGSDDAFLALLDCCLPGACRESGMYKTIRIVSDRPVVDIDFSGRHGHNTGIQRVVRETVSRWAIDRDFELIVWSEYGTTMRAVDDNERELVLKWTSGMRNIRPARHDTADTVTIVPWQSIVILPEVIDSRAADALMAVARYSGNSVVAVGYDAIPIVSADLVSVSDSNRYAQYLSVVKHMDRVLAISESAAEEFRGFASAVRVQGLPGPEILTVPLPVDSVMANAEGKRAESELPLVLSVGTREYRKNQTSILVAAEMLWREGHRFELLFIGGDAIELSGDFYDVLTSLRRAKRPVAILRNASDEALLDAYARARFSVFISLHEGYGLPVGESLAHHTPVLASNYGSVGEIARQGGCVAVDPRDDDAIRNAMRSMLTDDALIDLLRSEILSRPLRSWDDYAQELWAGATHPIVREA